MTYAIVSIFPNESSNIACIIKFEFSRNDSREKKHTEMRIYQKNEKFREKKKKHKIDIYKKNIHE
jgi:hypothetical protein